LDGGAGGNKGRTSKWMVREKARRMRTTERAGRSRRTIDGLQDVVDGALNELVEALQCRECASATLGTCMPYLSRRREGNTFTMQAKAINRQRPTCYSLLILV
jgi:hypothetical protein